MGVVHVIAEANRCLECRRPLCQEGCPIHTPIPQMMHMLKEGKRREAGEMLFANNPLSVVCSLVCDHEKQCEGHCIQGRKGQPIHISSVENYISDSCLDALDGKIPQWNGRRIACIGAGPAGITIALEMARRGYKVTVFDSKDKIGGILRYGIPDFRLPKTILERYGKKLKEWGIMVRPNTTIGGALDISDLFRDGYQAIFIGTGVWRPKKLGIKGESLGNVHFAMDYLVNPDSYDLGDNVAVIGAGNTAMDVARTLLRKGTHNVTVYARRNVIRATGDEYEYAKLDGTNFVTGKQIMRLTERGPIFADSVFDEDGRVIGTEPGSEKLYPSDSVILATIQGPKSKLVNTTDGLKASAAGLLLTDENGQTTCPGIYAAGDVVLGARTVVEAAAYAKKVAVAMDEYVQSLPPVEDDDLI